MGNDRRRHGQAIRTRQAKNKRDSNGVLTGRPGTVYDVDIKYTAPDGAKKSYTKRGFATKREAAQHEAEMKTKLQNPGQIASITSQRKQTVAAYLNDWVESYARVNLRHVTARVSIHHHFIKSKYFFEIYLYNLFDFFLYTLYHF